MVAIVAGNGLGLNLSSGLILGSAGVLGSAGLGRGNDRAYVNAATGNLVVQSRDDLLIGRGLDVQSLRTYNSQGKLNDDNGDNWLTNFARRITGLVGNANKAGSQVTRIDEDGSESVFNCSADGSAYVCKTGAGAFDTLKYDTKLKEWTFVEGSSRVNETYELVAGTSQSWRLKTLTDSDGNPLTLDYAVNGLISTITTANGEKTRYTYHDENNNAQIESSETLLKSISTVDAAGNLLSTRVHYGYDAQRRLQTVTVDLIPEDNSIQDNKTLVTTYTYDGPSKRVATIGQSDGSLVVMGYEKVGEDYRVKTLTQTVQGEETRLTSFTYDTENRKTTVTDALNNQTILSYDALGQLLSTRVLAPDGVKLQEFSYTYDAEGNVSGAQVALIDTTKAAGEDTEVVSAVTYRYDSKGNQTQTLQRDALSNANTNTVERIYGTKNELLVETRYTSPDPDGAGPAAPGGALTTRYVYDLKNHLRFVVSPEGRVTEYRYTPVGALASSIQFVKDRQTAQPAAESFSLQQMLDWVDGKDLTNRATSRSESMRTDYYYDARGNVTKTIRSSQWTIYEGIPPQSYIPASGGAAQDNTANLMEVVNFIYEAAGNLLQKHVRTTGVDAAETSAAENYTYDGLGRMLTATGLASGNKTYQYFDASNQTIITLANDLTTTATYNKSGELVSLTSAGPGVSASTTLYAYDALGRLRVTTEPDGSKQHKLYDSAGRKVADIDANGSFTEYVYNGNNQLRRLIHYAQPLNETQLASLSLVDSKGFVQEVRLADVWPTANAGLDQSSWNLYDAAGRLVKTVDAQGYVIEMRYDGASRVTDTLKYANRLDAAQLDRLSRIPDPANASPQTDSADRLSRAFYDKDGLLTNALDAEGYLTSYYYDAAGRNTTTWRRITQVTGPSFREKATEAELVSKTAWVWPKDADSRKYYDARGLLRAERDEAGFVTYYEYNSRNQITRKVRGGRLDNTAFTAAQTVTLEIKAVGTTNTGTWPVLRVYVANRPAQELVVDGTTGTYRLEFTNVILAEGNRVDLELMSPVGDVNRSVRIDQILLNGAEVKLSSGVIDKATTGTTTEDLKDVVAAPGQILQGSNRLRLYSQSFDGLDDNWLTDSTNSATLGSSVSPSVLTQTYSYDKYGRLISSAGFEGYSSYSYDIVGNRVSASLSSDAQGSDKRTATTQYDVLGRVIAELSGRGSAALALLGSSASAAQVKAVWDQWALEYAYDAMGRRISSTDQNNNRTVYYYDVDGNLRFTINALGEVQENRYNALGQRTDAISYTQRLASPQSLLGGLVTSDLTAQVSTLANAAADQRTQYAYTTRGQVETTTNAAGGKQIVSYSAFGEVQSIKAEVDGAGTFVEEVTLYDKRGLIINTFKRTWEGLNKDIEARAEERVLQYDAWGRLTSSKNGAEAASVISYLNGGRTITSSDALSVSQTTELNAFGQVVKLTDRNQLSTETIYSNSSRNIRVISPLKNATTTEQNVFGQVLTVRNEMGIVVERRSYNEDGLLTRLVDSQGHLTDYTYDAAGRLLVTRQYADSIAYKDNSQFMGDLSTQLLTGSSLKVSYQAGTNSSARQSLGSFKAGDVVTVSAWFKTDNRSRAGLFIGDARTGQTAARQNYRYAVMDGDNGWQQITASITLKNDEEDLYLYLYANSLGTVSEDGQTYTTGAGAVGSFVQYTSIKAQSVRRGTVLDDASTATVGGWFAEGLALGVVSAATNDERVNRVAYDAAGRVRYSVGATGLVAESVYDAASRLLAHREYAQALVVPESTGELSAAFIASQLKSNPGLDRTTTYAYDAQGRQTFAIDGLGAVTESIYDLAGRKVASKQYAKGLTVPRNTSAGPAAAVLTDTEIRARLQATTEQDRATRYVYDQYGRVRFAIDALGGTTEYKYDTAGRTTSTLRYERQLSISGITPSESALVAATAKVPFRLTRSLYNANGQEVYRIDAIGGVNEFSYDGLGQVTRTYQYAKDIAASDTDTLATMQTKVAAAVSADDRITYSVYDEDRNLRFTVDALGGVTENCYDAAGNVIKRIEYAGAIKTPTPIKSALTLADVRSAIVTTEAVALNDRVTRYFYDQAGRIRFIVDAEGYLSETVHLADGVRNTRYKAKPSPISETAKTADLTPVITAIAVAADDVSTESRIDLVGRVVRTVDGTGVTTTYGYDTLGNLERTTVAAGLPESSTTFYSYDQLGQKTSITTAWGTSVAATTRMELDAFGQVVVEYSPNAEAIVSSEGAWAVDMRSRLKFSANAAGLSDLDKKALRANFKATHTYDQLGRKISTTNAQDKVSRTEYDRFGNAVKITDPMGFSGYFYFDKNDRLTLQVDPEGRATETQYLNVFDREAYKLIRFSSRINSPLDPAKKPSTIATPDLDVVDTFIFDRLGRLLTHSRPGSTGLVTSATQYGVDGNRFNQKLTNPADGHSLLSYDRLGQLVSETLPVTVLNASGQPTTVSNSYSYDGLGQRVSRSEAVGLQEARTTTFRYDKQGRLTHKIGQPFLSVVDPANRSATTLTVPVEQTTYDAQGRILEIRSNAQWNGSSVEGGTRALRYYNAAGQLTATLQADGALTHFTYDAQGQVVEECAFASKTALPTNPGGDRPSAPTALATGQDANRLTRSSYDTLGRLLSKTRHDIVSWTYQENDKGEVITSVDADNDSLILGAWQYDDAGRTIVTQDGRGNKTFTYYDKLGRQTLFIDAEGYATSYYYGDVFDTPDKTIRYANRVAQYNTTAGVLVDELKLLSAAEVVAGYGADKTNRLDSSLSAARLDAFDAPNAMTSESLMLVNVAAGTKVKFSVLTKAAPQTQVVISVLNAAGQEIPNAKVSHFGGGDWFVLTVETTLIDAQGVRIKLGVDTDNNPLKRREGAFAYFDNLTAQYNGTITQLDLFRPNGSVMATWINQKTNTKNIAVEWVGRSDPTLATATGLLDRITWTNYYRSGLIKSKVVQRVQIGYVDVNDTVVSVDNWIDTQYSYNALGKLQTTAQEQRDKLADPLAEAAQAAKDGGFQLTSEFEYDALGRETRRLDPEFRDVDGVQQRTYVTTQYDGLGNVILRTVGAVNRTEKRDTRFKYNSAGQLVQQIDASGNVTEYDYDAAGNVLQRVVRNVLKADGGIYDHTTRFEYDSLARVSAQIDVGTGEIRETQYNAFGDISARGIANLNTTGSRQKWPEFIVYNALGKIERSNSEGGVSKLYLYDRNGNTSMQIKATGYGANDLRSLDVATAAGNRPDLLKTYSDYDRRNQLIRTVEMNVDFQKSEVSFTGQQYETLAPKYQKYDTNSGQYQGTLTKNLSYTAAANGGVGNSFDSMGGVSVKAAWTLDANYASLSNSGDSLTDAWNSTNDGSRSFSTIKWGLGSFSSASAPPASTFNTPSSWPTGIYIVVGPNGVEQQSQKTTSTVATLTIPKTDDFIYGDSTLYWKPSSSTSAVRIPIGTFVNEQRLDGETKKWEGGQYFTMTAKGFIAKMPVNTVMNLRATAKTGSGAELPLTTRALDNAVGAASIYWWVDTAGIAPSQSIVLRGMWNHDVTHGFGDTNFLNTYSLDAFGMAVPSAVPGRMTATWVSYSGPNQASLRFQPDHVGGSAGATMSVRCTSSGDLTWKQIAISDWTAALDGLASGAYEYFALFPSGNGEFKGNFTKTRDGFNNVVVTVEDPKSPGNTGTAAGELVRVYGRQLSTVAQTFSIVVDPRTVSRASPTEQIYGFDTYVVLNGVEKRIWTSTTATGVVRTTITLKTSDFGITPEYSGTTKPLDFRYYLKGWAETDDANRTKQFFYMGGDAGKLTFGADPSAVVSQEAEYAPTVTINRPLTGNIVVKNINSGYTLNFDASNIYRRIENGVTTIDLSRFFNFSAPSLGAVNLNISYQDAEYSFSSDYTVASNGLVTAGAFSNKSYKPIVEFVAPSLDTTQISIKYFDANNKLITVAASRITRREEGGRALFDWNVDSHKPSSGVSPPVRYEFTMSSASGETRSQGSGNFKIESDGEVIDAFSQQSGYIKFSPPAGTETLTLISPDPKFGTRKLTAAGPNPWTLFTYDLQPSSGSVTYSFSYSATGPSSSRPLSSGSNSITVASSGGFTMGVDTPDFQATLVELRFPQSNAFVKVQYKIFGASTWTDSKVYDRTVNTTEYLPGYASPGFVSVNWEWPDRNIKQYTLNVSLFSDSACTKPLRNSSGQPMVNTLETRLSDNPDQAPEVLQKISIAGGKSSQIRRMQSYNAFGEVAEEWDDVAFLRMKEQMAGAGNGDWDAVRTLYKYNTLGKLVSKEDPQSWQTYANSFRERIKPVTSYAYDAMGRLVSSTDANGGRTSVRYRGASEDMIWQRDALGYVKSTGYDLFGQKVRLIENIDLSGSKQRKTEYGYDDMGRLTELTRYVETDARALTGKLINRYTYDAFGQRLSTEDAAGGLSTTSFDTLGRVVKTTSAQGISVSYQYSFVATDSQAETKIYGAGEQNFGGYEKITTNATGVLKDRTDYFGRTTWHQDMGGRLYTYRYNHAGWLTEQYATDSACNGKGNYQNLQFTYLANGLVYQTLDLQLNARNTVSTYGYDNDGNRIYEEYGQLQYKTDKTADSAQGRYLTSSSYQTADIKYDELGRMVKIVDPKQFSLSYEYDANGNRIRALAYYYDPLQNYAVQRREDNWYQYDALNRFTLTQGELYDSTNPTWALTDTTRETSKTGTRYLYREGLRGTRLGYDGLGQRISARYFVESTGKTVGEAYGYSADGYLVSTEVDGVIRSRRILSALGRTETQIEYTLQGPNGPERSTKWSYDKDGKILSEVVTTGTAFGSQEGDGTTNYYYYDLGISGPLSVGGRGELALKTFTANPSVSKAQSTATSYTYSLWDSAKQSALRIANDALSGDAAAIWARVASTAESNRTGNTTLTYDANGFMLNASVQDATDGQRWMSYFNDAQGKVMRRSETKLGKSYVTNWYYASGHVVGNTSTDPTANRRNGYVEYLAQITSRGQVNKDKFKDLKAVTSSDFDQNYQAITATYPAHVGSAYTVNQTGESLQNIAASLWGDAALWWLLADANGLSGTETLVANQVLVVPNKVTNIHNNASTFKPYNPGEVIGNIDPAVPVPPPPAKGGCGTLGTILMVVVAIVVTIYTAGAAAGWLMSASGTALGAGATVAAGASTWAMGAAALAGGLGAGTAMVAVGAAAIGAAVGSIASQAFGMAIGQVDSFSWKAVGQAALTAGVTAGVGSYLSSAAQGATAAQGTTAAQPAGWLNGNPVGNVLTAPQGSWSAVAGNAIRGAVGAAANMAIRGDWNWRQVAASTVGSAAGAALQKSDAFQSAMGQLGAAGAYVGAGITGAASGWASSQALGLNRQETRAVMTQSFVQSLGNAIGSSVAEAMSSTDQGANNRTLLNRAERASDPDRYATDNRTLLNLSNQASDPEYYSQAPDSPEQLASKRRYLATAVAGPANPDSSGVGDVKGYKVLKTLSDGRQLLQGPNGPVLVDRERDRLDSLWVRPKSSADAFSAGIATSLAKDAAASGTENGSELQAWLLKSNPMLEQVNAYVDQFGISAGDKSPLLGAAVRGTQWLMLGDGTNLDLLLAAGGPLLRTEGRAALTLEKRLTSFEATEAVEISGRRAASELGASYQGAIARMYGQPARDVPYMAIVDGEPKWLRADAVTRIDGRETAIEAKYIDDWARSPRNPVNDRPFPPNAPMDRTERAAMLEQARNYSTNFEGGAIYHTNSVELATYWSKVFNEAGLQNIRWLITPAVKR